MGLLRCTSVCVDKALYLYQTGQPHPLAKLYCKIKSELLHLSIYFFKVLLSCLYSDTTINKRCFIDVYKIFMCIIVYTTYKICIMLDFHIGAMILKNKRSTVMHKIALFIPMYNCAPQIGRVLKKCRDTIPSGIINCIICVDNRSTDETLDECIKGLEEIQINTIILQNDENYGLGGSHKVAIQYALSKQYTHLIVLHGDDQGSIEDLFLNLNYIQLDDIDCLLGSRFMTGSKLVGYSFIRTAANLIFNSIFSLISGQKLYDLGSGLNLYRLQIFEDGFHIKFSDDLTFNYYLLLASCQKNLKQKFFPLTWIEYDQISNAKLLSQGIKMIQIIFERTKSPQEFLVTEHRKQPRLNYTYKIIKSS